jgi:hypothetical protein
VQSFLFNDENSRQELPSFSAWASQCSEARDSFSRTLLTLGLCPQHVRGSFLLHSVASRHPAVPPIAEGRLPPTPGDQHLWLDTSPATLVMLGHFCFGKLKYLSCFCSNYSFLIFAYLFILIISTFFSQMDFTDTFMFHNPTKKSHSYFYVKCIKFIY